MKNKILTLMGMVLLVGLYMSSCSKDDGTGTVADHPTVAKLKKHEWIITSQTLNGSDVFTAKDACVKDDTYVFMADSICKRYENAVECDATNPGPFTSEWYFNDDYTDLSFDLSDYTVKEFTATKLVIQEKSGTGAVFISTLEPK